MPRTNKDNGSRHGYSPDLMPQYKEVLTGSKHMLHIKGGGKKFVAATAAAKAAGRKRK